MGAAGETVELVVAGVAVLRVLVRWCAGMSAAAERVQCSQTRASACVAWGECFLPWVNIASCCCLQLWQAPDTVPAEHAAAED